MKNDAFYRGFMVKLVWKLDTLKLEIGDFMVKLARRFFGNLIYHIFFIKPQDKIHNFCIL